MKQIDYIFIPLSDKITEEQVKEIMQTCGNEQIFAHSLWSTDNKELCNTTVVKRIARERILLQNQKCLRLVVEQNMSSVYFKISFCKLNDVYKAFQDNIYSNGLLLSLDNYSDIQKAIVESKRFLEERRKKLEEQLIKLVSRRVEQIAPVKYKRKFTFENEILLGPNKWLKSIWYDIPFQ